MKQDVLLHVVQTWNLNPKPEYRGFRCANCQRYLHKAWHHWITSGGYRTPVHLCQSCEGLFKKGKLKARGSRRPALKSRFYTNLSSKVRAQLRNFIGRTSSRPVYKSFTCDKCRTSFTKAYHVWLFLRGSLNELHLCKRCGDTVFKV